MTEHEANSEKTVQAELIDELTDGLAVIAVVAIALWGEPSQMVMLTIASIALGKNYLRGPR